MASQVFRFKKFSIEQAGAAHPVGTDGVLLGAWADVADCRNILDIGTGTGLVALMLAQKIYGFLMSTPPPTPPPPVGGRGGVKITAVEIHPPSAALARQNFAASPWADRLEAVESSIQDFAQQTDRQFDLIVSNPPFFSEKVVSPDASRRLGRHTASLPPGDLLAAAKKLLTENGRLCVILPVLEGRRFCELAVASGLYCTEETEVRTRPQKPAERLLLRFEKTPCRFEKKTMSIHAEGGGYSEEFRRLTGDFYL
jgi:tRNA1Val (adenine37-N6)-methyltransferase